MAGQRKIETEWEYVGRRKGPSFVTPYESRIETEGAEQRFANYSKLIDRVVDVFGDEITASKWLSTPSSDFDQKSPLQVARDDAYQMTALEPVLIRIEHGVYF
jgi:uncharacterized protein (DUF2384 family)